MLLNVGAENRADHELSEAWEIVLVHVLKDVKVLLRNDLEGSSAVVVLQYGIIVVSDRKLSRAVDLKHVVSAGVLHVVHEPREKQRGDSRLRKVLVEVRDLENIVRRTHDRNSVLEIVEGVVRAAVVLIDLRDKTAELEGADFVGFDDLCVGEHRPDVAVELVSIRNKQVVGSGVLDAG